METLYLDKIRSPLGTLLLVTDGARLCALDYEDYEPRMRGLLERRFESFRLAPAADPCGFSRRLRHYLEGDFRALASIPVNPGGTVFQQQVWAAIRAIPPGETETYGALGLKVGRPSAARAVGAATGLNPIAIVIPCHRVLGAGGALTGYAGGLERKQWLLQHEAGALRSARSSLSLSMR